MEHIESIKSISHEFGEFYVTEALRHYSTLIMQKNFDAKIPATAKPIFRHIAEQYIEWENQYLKPELSLMVINSDSSLTDEEAVNLSDDVAWQHAENLNPLESYRGKGVA